MTTKLNFIVEGQTEEAFVNRTLHPYLEQRSIIATARSLLTSIRNGYEYRGGLTGYEQAKRDITDWMNEDRLGEQWFTTMFDLYKLPHDFPGYNDAALPSDPYQRVSILEAALSDDIADSRFIPYIQLHEFEALLLADPAKLDLYFYEYEDGIARLVEMAEGFDSPELIDDGDVSAPSKRIIGEIREYEYWKASAGPIVADEIGLDTLRIRCKHFGEWLAKLEDLE